MEWISTKDRMPEENEDILFTEGKDIYRGYWTTFLGKAFHQTPPEDQYFGDDFSLEQITHWMPLPKLPNQ